MEETQKSSYLSLGIFLKLLSRYTRKDKSIAEKRFLGANNTVISTTIFKYFISALTLKWYTDDNERSDTLKSLNSNLINCKKELFNFKFLMTEKDEIKAAFIRDVQSDKPTALVFMTEFVLYCIDENKCRQMVDELLRAIRDDNDIADDTEFYIFGNGKSTSKRKMVDKQFNFTADCFLLGVWHFLIRERSESNRIGRDTLVDWYGTSTETYGKSQIGTELRRNVWEPLGREIRVIPSEHTIVKEEKAVSQDNVKQEHRLFVYDMNSLSEEEQESLERLKKSRILRDLLRACHIGTCGVEGNNNFENNHRFFVMALKRCDQFVFNNNYAKRIKDDIITLKDWLEAFVKLIKPNDKSYSAYSDRVKASIIRYQKILDEVYTTLYGSRPALSGERISLLLSVVKI
ncbi:hypothetical protein [uncultured Ruminococcus sp.]|mgnify:FL=1|uniref:hypothetical protein n=1 Tax=uncultured Ruminococcus sp. TaxID=165186 RepID=UPI0025F439FB|nr:hypothetical protein [uncultured Ruminococcus sp.]